MTKDGGNPEDTDLLMPWILPETAEVPAYQTLSQVRQSLVVAQAEWDQRGVSLSRGIFPLWRRFCEARKSINQHRTSNFQHRTRRDTIASMGVGCWVLDVSL